MFKEKFTGLSRQFAPFRNIRDDVVRGVSSTKEKNKVLFGQSQSGLEIDSRLLEKMCQDTTQRRKDVGRERERYE